MNLKWRRTHLAFAFRAHIVRGHQLPVQEKLLVAPATVVAFRMAFAVDQSEARLAFALVATGHVHAVRVRTALIERIVFAFINVCWRRALAEEEKRGSRHSSHSKEHQTAFQTFRERTRRRYEY